MTSCFYSVPKLFSVVSVQDFYYKNVSLNYSGTHISFVAAFPWQNIRGILGKYDAYFLSIIDLSLWQLKKNGKLEKYSNWVKIYNWTNQFNHFSKSLIALSMKISMVLKY